MSALKTLTPTEVRHLCRNNQFTKPTPGYCLGFVQANLVILPQKYAYDFLLFCVKNPKPCPILDVTEIGNYEPKLVATGADLRTDLPRYRIWKHGKLIEEVNNIKLNWQDDFICFLLGCSFSFEDAMLRAKLPVKHIQENKNVPMYRTNIPLQTAGIFKGNLVVSMRPLTPIQAIKSVEITSRFPKSHGTPIHFGNPEQIGITNINNPDFGEAVTINQGEIPVFWACGVTPQLAIIESKPDLAITHSPGYMFITDLKDEELNI